MAGGAPLLLPRQQQSQYIARARPAAAHIRRRACPEPVKMSSGDDNDDLVMQSPPRSPRAAPPPPSEDASVDAGGGGDADDVAEYRDSAPPSLISSIVGGGDAGDDDDVMVGDDYDSDYYSSSDESGQYHGEQAAAAPDDGVAAAVDDNDDDDDDDAGRDRGHRRGWLRDQQLWLGALLEAGVAWCEDRYGAAMRAARWTLQPLAVAAIGYMAYAVFMHVLPLLHRVIEARRFAPHHHGSPWGVPAVDAAYALAAYLLFATSYAFARTAFVSPGFEPRPAVPPPAAADRLMSEQQRSELTEMLDNRSTPEFCIRCWAPRAARSHHCRVTGRCVRRFDHYCPWVGAPIGARNRAAFLGLLWNGGAGAAYAAALAISLTILAPAALHGTRPPTLATGSSWVSGSDVSSALTTEEWLHLFFVMVIGIGAGIALLGMACWWTFLAARGYTTPEFWRAVRRRGLWGALMDPYAAPHSCGGPIDTICEYVWGAAALRTVSG